MIENRISFNFKFLKFKESFIFEFIYKRSSMLFCYFDIPLLMKSKAFNSIGTHFVNWSFYYLAILFFKIKNLDLGKCFINKHMYK